MKDSLANYVSVYQHDSGAVAFHIVKYVPKAMFRMIPVLYNMIIWYVNKFDCWLIAMYILDAYSYCNNFIQKWNKDGYGNLCIKSWSPAKMLYVPLLKFHAIINHCSYSCLSVCMCVQVSISVCVHVLNVTLDNV